MRGDRGGPRRTLPRAFATLVAACALGGGLMATPAAAAPNPPNRNHCFNPAGIDLNELYATQDAFITPFCTVAHPGDLWRPLVRWVGASTHETVPVGYVPEGATPAEDFLLKLQSVRYVVDAGTRAQRTFRFRPSQLLITTGDLPDGATFVAYTPRMRPLAPGMHTVDIYETLRAETWDGLGLEPENHIPAGESHVSSVTFEVNWSHRVNRDG